MDISSWADVLAQIFPGLSKDGYEIVGEPSVRYNCIAYAAGDDSDWWTFTDGRYWPDYATRTDRMDSLIEVFVGLGYQQCQDSSLESGFEKKVKACGSPAVILILPMRFCDSASLRAE